ncbi:MAG: [LysW]-aminoadipate kinase [Chloroflexi bacterium]|nr:[LysW]-aminoadipate kinase [Chloroflexota bacterium]
MIHVLKLGGGAGIDYGPVLDNLAGRLRAGERWVLVHGASAMANALAEQAGYAVQTITSPGGHVSRYTDARMIELYRTAAEMVNDSIVAQLERGGAAVVGLSSPGVIRARRKEAIRAIRNGRQVVIRDDYSGTITGIDAGQLGALLDAGVTPVVAPVALGEQGEALNIDGDLVAATIAHTLDAAALIILSNVPGLLRDVRDPSSVVAGFEIPEIERYGDLAQGRMKKKLIAAQQAEVIQTIIAGAHGTAPIDRALSGGGTHIWRRWSDAQFGA